MTIEALDRLTLKTREGQSRTLERGMTIDLPDNQALTLCARASGHVWVHPEGNDWPARWKAIAMVTHGLTREDSRLTSVLRILEELNAPYLQNDLATFQKILVKLRNALRVHDPTPVETFC